MKLELFHHPTFGDINVVKDEDGKPLFKATDIASALGYSQPKVAISKLCKGVSILETPTENQHGAVVMQPIRYIKEADVYRLVMRSKLPEAEKFQDWVVEEVLPCIRQNGAYLNDSVNARLLEDPDFIIELATELKRQKEEIRLAKIREEKHRALISEQKKEIAQLGKKATYVDMVLASPALLTVTQIAQDYGMSAVKFNALLAKFGVQYKTNRQWVLYSTYKSQGYVQSSTTLTMAGKIVMTTSWTQKGRLFLYETLKKRGVLPVIEKEQYHATRESPKAQPEPTQQTFDFFSV